eukprot:2164211-Pyramimonas_sp.AAC.1
MYYCYAGGAHAPAGGLEGVHDASAAAAERRRAAANHRAAGVQAPTIGGAGGGYPRAAEAVPRPHR